MELAFSCIAKKNVNFPCLDFLHLLRRSLSGEDGRFVLPEKGVIDDVFNFTLNDYRVAVDADITDLLTIFWIKRGASSKGESEKPDGSGSNENDKKTL